jgi:anti-anti-sigma factor
MEVFKHITKKHSVIKIDGKFNIDYIEDFDYLIKDVFDSQPILIAIELSTVEYIDSSALGSLIKSMNIAKKHNIAFHLYNLKESIHDVFKLSYLDKFFSIKTIEEMENLYPDQNFHF